MHIRRFVYSCIILLFATIGGLYYFIQSHPQLRLTKASFNQLPHWENGNLTDALQAFQQSCRDILKRPNPSPFSTLPQSGKNRDWQAICVALQHLNKTDSMTARRFFETWFDPYRVSNHFNSRGLFTGYYLPLIHGQLKQNKLFSIPIYALPHDLVSINLGLFRPELTGKMAIGQLKQNALYPYPDRAAINRGAITNHARVLAWSDSALDVFFAQIQGSAKLQLPDHQQFLMSYAGNNGHAYTAIGKILVQNKALTKTTVSMQNIRQWLLQHPEQIDTILNQNASYVFFNLITGRNPLGAERVPLTPQHSLAVDPHFIPLGTPVWLDTTIPDTDAKTVPFQQLLIAQDTGGAIKGIVRGDVYWGEGEKAAFIAGQMQSAGEYWILLPKNQEK